MTRLHISNYAGRDWSEVAAIIDTSVGRHLLDDRVEIYGREPDGNHNACGAPLAFMTVTCQARLGLCCFDWKRLHAFGDLRQERLDAVVMSESVQSVSRQLGAGDRRLPACRRCGTSRG